jgi:hypothetical protein
MSAESTVYDTLKNYAPLAAEVGLRIFPEVAAQGSDLPLVVYSKTQTEDFNALTGARMLTRNRFQVSGWDLTRDRAEQMIDLVVAALAASGVPVEGRSTAFDEDVGLHGASVEFDTWT